MTCFTCEKSRSNEECNRKAIDETCEQKLAASEHLRESSLAPNGRNYSCMTVHKFDAQNTISIEKKCSTDCRPDMIGCFVETVKRLGAIQQIQVGIFFKRKNFKFHSLSNNILRWRVNIFISSIFRLDLHVLLQRQLL